MAATAGAITVAKYAPAIFVNADTKEAFVFHQLGYGTAISLVLVLIGAVFSLLFVRAARSQA